MPQIEIDFNIYQPSYFDMFRLGAVLFTDYYVKNNLHFIMKIRFDNKDYILTNTTSQRIKLKNKKTGIEFKESDYKMRLFDYVRVSITLDQILPIKISNLGDFSDRIADLERILKTKLTGKDEILFGKNSLTIKKKETQKEESDYFI